MQLRFVILGCDSVHRGEREIENFLALILEQERMIDQLSPIRDGSSVLSAFVGKKRKLFDQNVDGKV